VTQYDNTDRGVLFKNDRKTTDSHPDYTGNINVGGQEFWLSAWIKEGQRGKFMSLSVKPKDEQRQQPQRPAPRAAPAPQQRRSDPISSGRQPMQRQNIIPDDDDMGGDSIPF
jgi:hypothetical protein